MLNANQLRECVVGPVLRDLGMWSQVAENLVMGIAAQESALVYIHQVGGPAMGLWQMEPATHTDLWTNYILRKPRYQIRLARIGYDFPECPRHEMLYDLRYAAAVCRLQLYRKPFAMPLTATPLQLGEIWKKHWNTYLGKGTVDQFIKAYEIVDRYQRR